MTGDSFRQGRATELMGRLSEQDALDRLIEAVGTGRSRVLGIRGDPGVGKTVLLDYLARRASGSGFRVARVVGVQSEMELAFAGCISCARRCCATWRACRCRSARHCA